MAGNRRSVLWFLVPKDLVARKNQRTVVQTSNIPAGLESKILGSFLIQQDSCLDGKWQHSHKLKREIKVASLTLSYGHLSLLGNSRETFEPLSSGKEVPQHSWAQGQNKVVTSSTVSPSTPPTHLSMHYLWPPSGPLSGSWCLVQRMENK